MTDPYTTDLIISNTLGGYSGTPSPQNFAPIQILTTISIPIDVTSTGNTFTNSQAKQFGGHIYISNLNEMSDTTFTESGSTYTRGIAWNGGAIYCKYCTKVLITDATFEGNYGKVGGALNFYYDTSSTNTLDLTITTTIFTENKSFGVAGAICINEAATASIYYTNAIIHLTSVTATNNIAAHTVDSTPASTTGYGGFMQIVALSYSIVISDGTYKANSGYKGGSLYLQSFKNTYYTSSLQFMDGVSFQQS